MNYPDLVKAMKNSDHHWDNQKLNPFHLEGDVWTHTCMVLLMAHTLKVPDEVKIACLLHDIGKPFAEERKEETERVRFFGHEGLSFYMAIDIVDKYLKTQEQKDTALKLIAQHSIVYDYLKVQDGVPVLNKPEEFKRMFANQGEYFKMLLQMVECDSKGRFCHDLNDPREMFDKVFDAAFFESLIIEVPPVKDKIITLLVGPPRAGKSTYIRDMGIDDVIISRDDKVLKYGTGRGYSEKWRSLTDEDQKKIDAEILQDFNKAVKAGLNITVDMTNMSKKSRRKWSAKGYSKDIKLFYTGYDELMRRNWTAKTADDKFIPESVIKMMCQGFVYPTLDECHQ